MGCETVFITIRNAIPLHVDSVFEFGIFTHYEKSISEHVFVRYIKHICVNIY
jgi:hypothetical protein